MAEQKQEPPRRLIVCFDGHKPVIADWPESKTKQCDVVYVPESEVARVRRAYWNQALDAAIQVVNDARVEGGELREVRERIRGLKARDESEDQQHG